MTRRYEGFFGWQEIVSRLKVPNERDIVLVASTQISSNLLVIFFLLFMDNK